MDRRMFIKSLMAGGTGLFIMGDMVYSSSEKQSDNGFDRAAAMRVLSEHRLANMEARTLRDHFSRRVGRNAKG